MICDLCGDDLSHCRCFDLAPQRPPVEDECGSTGHAYHGDEWETTEQSIRQAGDTAGRCYCGRRRYPAGGPPPTPPKERPT